MKRRKAAAVDRVAKRSKGNSGAASSSAPSPFTSVSNRSKFSVLNRRPRGKTKQTQAKAEAIASRKSALLSAYNSLGKTNEFKDKRFGEGHNLEESSLSKDEKALWKFTRERQKKANSKSRRYNLRDDDDSGEDESLTHGGQKISEIQHLGNQGSSEEEEQSDDDSGRLDALSHFGGGEGDRRSKKEVMEEIILKSKMHKMERQKQLEENRSMVTDLDGDFGSLMRSLQASGLDVKRQGEDAGGADEFMLEARKLEGATRERASDRLKSREEIAVEEAQKLKELERLRLRRMRGIASDDSDDETAPSGAGNDETLDGNVKIDKRSRFQDEEDGDEDEDDDDDEEEEEEDAVSGDEGERHGDREQVSGRSLPIKSATQAFRVKEQDIRDVLTARKLIDSHDTSDLPFTFACPKSFGELEALLHKRPVQDQATILTRIRVCNSPKISPSNFPKMTKFYGLVLDRVFYACKEVEAAWASNQSGDALDLSSFQTEMDMLTRNICELSEACPRVASVVMRDRLAALRESVLSSGRFLTGSEVVQIKLIGHVFPTTDHRHHVTVPAFHFLAECLVRLPIRTARDVVVGLYVVNLLLDFTADSEKVIPEALMFLHAVADVWLNAPNRKSANPLTVNVLLPNVSDQFDRVLKLENDALQTALSFSLLFVPSDCISSRVCTSDAFLSAVSGCWLSLVKAFAGKYRDAPSFPELFNRFEVLLVSLVNGGTSGVLCNALRQQQQVLLKSIQECETTRRPLLQRVEAKSIAQLVPVFVENFRPDTLDFNKEKDGVKRLQKKLKREKKGAMKEVRRDAQIIAGANRVKQQRDDRTRQRKTNEIKEMLDGQQRDTNIMAGKKNVSLLKKERQAQNKARTYRKTGPKRS